MLSIKSLSYSYKKAHQILQDVSTNIAPGHVYGLLGLNGEGKTTLLKLIEGLLIPKQGEIHVGNLKSTSRSVDYFNEVFFLADESKLPDMGIENFGQMYGSFYSKYDHRAYLNNLKSFNIPLKNSLRALSLGQHRKVHISFALACNTAVLLMDEPSNGLDIPSKTIFRNLLAKTSADEKIFIIATHQIRDVDTLLDHLLLLKDGKIILDKNISELARKYMITDHVKPGQQIIYTQKELGGERHLIESESQGENDLNIEFLFNAFIQSNQSVEL